MRNWILFLILGLICSNVLADETVIGVPKNSIQTGIIIDVPASAKILTITAKGNNGAPFELYFKDGTDFEAGKQLYGQADYFSNNNGGTASLAIGTYATPALHEGKWYVAFLNRSTTQDTQITLTTSTSDTAEVPTDFQINFGKAPTVLEDAWDGADNLECDVAPWTDDTPLGNTTVGQFHQDLIKDTLEELSTQIHSPVPVHVQACWKEFDDGTYLFRGDAGMPLEDVWYAMAPAERLAGRRGCKLYSDVDCAIPEIVVWFNSADAAKGSYDGPEDEALIRSVMMHEVAHGLGFLSQIGVSKEKDDGSDNPNYLKFYKGYIDAYSANLGYVSAPEKHPSDYRVVQFANLAATERENALTSGQFLVWTDPALGSSVDNILRNNTSPRNLVELYAPSKIQPGSTLSHLSSVHRDQLMTAVIQRSHPQTLGLAGPMLARVGWNTAPIAVANPSNTPTPGNWYDPAHSGHGIDLELIARDPAGDQYAVIFYTYDANGKSEYYYVGGRLKDGHLVSLDNPAQPAQIGRPIYDKTTHKATYPAGAVGTMAIDFTAAAASEPACADRDGMVLAVMKWTLGNDSGRWCIAPLIGAVQYPIAAEDLNGLWNAGTSDSGWGMSVTQIETSSGKRISPYLLYYYDENNQPRWAQAELDNYSPGQTVSLYDIHGYCRTCEKTERTNQVIGSMKLGLTEPEHTELPSGKNRITVDTELSVQGAGDIDFERDDTALRMYSLPFGQ